MAVVLAQPSDPAPRPPIPAVGLGRTRSIGLLGSHEASLKDAPWGNPRWELWGHASSRNFFKRQPDRFFDLHRRECWTKSNNKGQKYLRWLETQPVPIYMQDRFPEIPASIRYPFEQVSLGLERRYFTNHVAYMIALALYEGVSEIGFFGVNYGVDTEYGTQRGSAEYWMGRAEAMGVKLVIPDTCTLLAEPKELYGYESHDEHGMLVPAYTRRTWSPPKDAKGFPINPETGLEQPPAWVQKAAADERLETPPPAMPVYVNDLAPVDYVHA